ncbi:MAG TPA: hypothetical protein ENO30_05505 [Thermodesulfobium narugense]|nr:hypothetical protein [Thermodesulfobium narugense]
MGHHHFLGFLFLCLVGFLAYIEVTSLIKTHEFGYVLHHPVSFIEHPMTTKRRAKECTSDYNCCIKYYSDEFCRNLK